MQMPTSESEQNIAVLPSVRKRKSSTKVREGGGLHSIVPKKSRRNPSSTAPSKTTGPAKPPAQPLAGPAQSPATPHPSASTQSHSNTVHDDDIDEEIDSRRRGFKPRTLPKVQVHELTDSDADADDRDDAPAGEGAKEDPEAELGTFETYLVNWQAID